MSLAVSASPATAQPSCHLRHLHVRLVLCLADERPEVHLGYELEAPASESEVGSMATVGVLMVEDGEDGVGLSDGPSVVADVDPSVGPGCEELAARRSKGSTTFSPYSSSAASARTI